MKKIYLIALLFSISVFTLKAQMSTPEQKAEEILIRIEKKYKEAKNIQAYFSYEMSNAVNGVQEEMKGSFVMQKTKFRLKLVDQEVINNGTTIWTYLKESNEVNISDYNPDSDEITPDKVFSLYKKDYKYVFVEEVVEHGKVYEVVDLQPVDKNKKHYKIRLKVNKSLNTIKSWEIFEKNQNRFKYTISEINYDVKVDDTYFSFNEKDYPGVEVIDLR